MRATGIVRRIDDLGRVVVPKEIRRTLRIKEGDPLEIFTDREGEIILKKYSPIGELGTFAKEYAEALASASGHGICITDRDQVIAAAGGVRKDYIGKSISMQMEHLIQEREQQMANPEEKKAIPIVGEEKEAQGAQMICPILSEGDAIGAVAILGKDQKTRMGDGERMLARCAAGFLGRQMEQ